MRERTCELSHATMHGEVALMFVAQFRAQRRDHQLLRGVAVRDGRRRCYEISVMGLCPICACGCDDEQRADGNS